MPVTLETDYRFSMHTTEYMTPANTGNRMCEKVITIPKWNSKRTKGNVD